jgi:hypothetical protein
METTEKKTINIFISQPMTGLTNEQIIENRAAAASSLRDKLGEKYNIKIINNLQMTEEKKTLEYLGYDIACMADADLVYFIGDWKTHRGCLVEEFVAKKYGYKCAYESMMDKVLWIILNRCVGSDNIEIPESTPVNAPFSPEELKDIAAMYDVYEPNEENDYK